MVYLILIILSVSAFKTLTSLGLVVYGVYLLLCMVVHYVRMDDIYHDNLDKEMSTKELEERRKKVWLLTLNLLIIPWFILGAHGCGAFS